MNEFIYAEFLFAQSEISKGISMLNELGDDFISIRNTDCYYNSSDSFIRVAGKLNSVTATTIILSNTFLAERIRTSYIPTSLKDMYRKR